MAKPMLIKTIKRILLGLIGVAVLAGMFWYINTYLYKFYASTPTVTIDSSSTVSQVITGNTFNVSTILSGQKMDSADLTITYDKDKLLFQDTVTSVPPDYFKVEYKNITDGTSGQSKLRLILIGQTTSMTSIQLNLGFKALKSGTATVNILGDSEIAGVNSNNEAIIFLEEISKANKTITIADGSSTGQVIAHWKMDDNVTGNNKTIDDFVGSNDAVTVVGANTTGVDCTVAGKLDKSCSFDGVDDYLKGTTPLTFGTKVSITSWIKTSDTDGAIFGIVSPSYSNSLALRISGGKLQGITDYSSNWPNNSVTSTKTVNDNQWHYVAFVVDDSTGYVYIDGVLDATKAMASSAGFTDNSWAIGYSDASWAPAYYAGQIDDLKLYNYALSSAEIMAQAGITPVVTTPTLTNTPVPLPTPPWENTDYTTTTVYGIVQDTDENGDVIEGKYWRKDASVCANATYSNSAQMNISGNYLDQCQGFNNLPYFLTVVRNPGSNLAYELKNLPDGYECVTWEHRLRIKSDGQSLKVETGVGCITAPLDISVQNATSSYDNSHFIYFKIRQIVEPTPTSILEQYESVLSMKVRFQGIPKAPREQYRKLNTKIVLKGGGQTVKEQTVEFTAQEDGTWTGQLGVDGINSATKYELIVKGAKHLAKKICVNEPSEQLGGTYRCTDPNMTLQKGENNLNFSNIIVLGGDLPQQDGIINALDFAFVRQNLGSQNPEDLIRGDINLDGIIDTQDHTIIKTALEFKYDEE